MATILYPTRGADPNQSNRERVIALAREREADLLLLYVANVQFLDRFASPVPVDLIEHELDEMAEFLLAVAQERVQEAGVASETMVRHGKFRQALKEVVLEREVETVVLGLPAQDTGITTAGFVEEVAQFLLDETGVEVFIVHEGEVVKHLQRGEAAGE